MLLAPGHPTYKVLVQPTLKCATCTWSPHIQGTRPTNTGVCYLCRITPHTRYSSNQHWSMLLAPGHPTYKVLVQPTLKCATCTWSPHIQGTYPTNSHVCYLCLVTPHTRYSSNQHWGMLLAPGHPTYKVLVQPTLKCATCTWSPHIQGTYPTNAGVCYMHLVTPHTRYSSNQHWSMLLAPGHPTYKVLVQPTLKCATCTWSPHIQGTYPTNAGVCYLHLVTPHTRYSSNQCWSMLLAPGHPTYKVLAQPTLMYASCAWSPYIQGIHPTNTGVCYLHLVTPHTRYSSNQHWSMLLVPDHPTYKVLVQPTLEYASCAWSPYIQGTHPTNTGVCYLHLVTPHTRYSSNQHWSMLLVPDHPTYKVLVQPTLEYATCTWSPHLQGTRPTNTKMCYLHLVTPHTRYLSNQCWSMLLAPGHPTYKVLIQPMLEYATCTWSLHIQGTRPTNSHVC